MVCVNDHNAFLKLEQKLIEKEKQLKDQKKETRLEKNMRIAAEQKLKDEKEKTRLKDNMLVAAEQREEYLLLRIEQERNMWNHSEECPKETTEAKSYLAHAIETSERIIQTPLSLKRHTKMIREQFENMAVDYTEFLNELYEMPQFVDTIITQGNVCKLSPRHSLLLGLICCVSKETQDQTASRFGISQSTVSRHFGYVKKFLKELYTSHEMYSFAISQCETVQELKYWIPGPRGGTLYVDATDQEIDNPKAEEHDEELDDLKVKELKANEPKRLYYSGKDKMHSLSTTFVANKNREILAISYPQPGRQHDSTNFKEMEMPWGKWADKMEDENTPPEERFTMFGDGAYIGDDKRVGLDWETPNKKPPKGELTEEQEAYNRWQHAERALIENTIGECRQYGCLQHQFEGSDDDFYELVCCVVSLSNYNHLWDKIRDRPTARLKRLKELWKVYKQCKRK